MSTPSRHTRYRQSNPVRMLVSSARRRAEKRGLPFDLREEDIVIPKVCPVLGIPLQHNWTSHPSDNSPTLDRLVPALGYLRGNVVVVSMRANRLRSDGTPKEFVQIARFYRKVPLDV